MRNYDLILWFLISLVAYSIQQQEEQIALVQKSAGNLSDGQDCFKTSGVKIKTKVQHKKSLMIKKYVKKRKYVKNMPCLCYDKRLVF